jgi:6-phosphogluconolactonase (cycloisomerase 2 family)
VVIYAIDGATGQLSKTGREIAVDTPVCLKFVRRAIKSSF